MPHVGVLTCVLTLLSHALPPQSLPTLLSDSLPGLVTQYINGFYENGLYEKIKLKRIINMKECAGKQNPVHEPWENLLFTCMLKRRQFMLSFKALEMFVSLAGFYALISSDTSAPYYTRMAEWTARFIWRLKVQDTSS